MTTHSEEKLSLQQISLQQNRDKGIRILESLFVIVVIVSLAVFLFANIFVEENAWKNLPNVSPNVVFCNTDTWVYIPAGTPLKAAPNTFSDNTYGKTITPMVVRVITIKDSGWWYRIDSALFVDVGVGVETWIRGAEGVRIVGCSQIQSPGGAK